MKSQSFQITQPFVSPPAPPRMALCSQVLKAMERLNHDSITPPKFMVEKKPQEGPKGDAMGVSPIPLPPFRAVSESATHPSPGWRPLT